MQTTNSIPHSLGHEAQLRALTSAGRMDAWILALNHWDFAKPRGASIRMLAPFSARCAPLEPSRRNFLRALPIAPFCQGRNNPR